MPETTCPGCAGPHLPTHPAGPLTFRHTMACPYLRPEDSRRLTDHFDRVDRPATPTERELLAHLGHRVPERLTTRVDVVAGIVRRTWPQLSPEGVGR